MLTSYCWVLFFVNKFLFYQFRVFSFLGFGFFAYKTALVGKRCLLYLNSLVR